MYVRPQIEGEPATFGVSGKLWRDSLVMFDRETETLWSQLLGERAAAVPFRLLEEHPVLNTDALGGPVVVFSPPGEPAAMVYRREVDGEPLRFEHVPSEDDRLVARDTETGST